LGPVSGAHFNPVVSFIEALRGNLSARAAVGYALVQIIGCVAGTYLAHAMFELPIIQTSIHMRAGPAQWLSEAVATAGLILIVIGSTSPRDAAWRVAAWIGAAYWFTASTSFANPAITIARALSNTFAGIAPNNAPAFIVSQLCGALLGLMLAKWLQIGTASIPRADEAQIKA
jgi:glycerol uptake facilitator-like aquaporin